MNHNLSAFQQGAIVIGFVVFVGFLVWLAIYSSKKEREAGTYVRNGGTPRTFWERQAKLVADFFKGVDEGARAPHILVTPYGILRYRFSEEFLVAFPSGADFAKTDKEISGILDVEPYADLAPYASALHIEVVGFERKNVAVRPRVFAAEGIVLSYTSNDPSQSNDDIENKLRQILAAHPDVDLKPLEADLGITIRSVQRKSKSDDQNEEFPPYDLNIGTKAE